MQWLLSQRKKRMTKRVGLIAVASLGAFASRVFSSRFLHDANLAFFYRTSRHSLILLGSKLLSSPSVSSSLSRTRTDPYLRRGYPLSERKIFMFFHALPATSDSRVEGKERCSGFFHSDKRGGQNVSA